MKTLASAPKIKVLAAMSGGVDSSVAALILQEAGYDVTGATMLLGVHRPEGVAGRFTDEAVSDAQAVCRQLGMAHLSLDFAELMERDVISPFMHEYLAGRTPNPCVTCNRRLKFGALLDKARELGFDYLATGHYARIEKTDSAWRLLRAKDDMKDQSYFLYAIRPDDLPFILFPLGGMTKREVRDQAARAGLPAASRTESQDICFVPDGDYGRVFSDRGLCCEPGDIVDASGRVLGRHRGIACYTIGQRGGLGVSAPAPLYVVSIDAKANRLIVGGKEDVLARGLIAGQLNILAGPLPKHAFAKIRYRKKPAPCRLESEGKTLRVVFDELQEAITPGQSVVFYDGDTVLGGGIIEKVIRQE